MLTVNDEKIRALFDELVPPSGHAPTVAGEIVRAINRIVYRNWNDGDHIGVGYGRETCNPAARYLAARCNGEIEALIWKLWGITNDDRYDEVLAELTEAVIAYIDKFPELKTTANSEDMWDFRDKDEDVDAYDEDEC